MNEDRLVLLASDGSQIISDAELISTALSGGNPELPSPSAVLPELRFSKLAAVLCLKIDYESEYERLLLSAEAFRGRKKAEICSFRDRSDSIIIDNTWYFLSNFKSTVDFLNRSGVSDTGAITIRQYLTLLQNSRSGEFPDIQIEDNAAEKVKTKKLQLKAVQSPRKLIANLYPYQQTGFRWLKYVTGQGCGCILGDEMGLGKTLQIIALIVSRRDKADSPALVIAPVSLLENWRREFQKFTVGTDVYVHHGSHRTGLYTDLETHDVVLMSYNSAVSDNAMLSMIRWDLIVVDEAQNIKNAGGMRTRSIKLIPGEVRVAVTGTPLENHITDLWSVMDFAEPGFLGTLGQFEVSYPDDVYGAERLEPVISPLILRRKVSEVARDLPERTDIEVPLVMSEREAAEYEAYRQEILSQYDGKHATLPLLQKLRMFCTHPEITEQTGLDLTESSLKYRRLIEMLEEIIETSEKTILFTSYRKMSGIMMQDIAERFHIPVYEINGGTAVSNCQKIVDEFSDVAGAALLILNPRAAGTGLNITAASRVIHYNPEWNPALTDQASARAYRRGQKQRVFVYRLIYEGTVEEVMNERILKKREMSGKAVAGTDGTENPGADIIRALMKTPWKGAEYVD